MAPTHVQFLEVFALHKPAVRAGCSQPAEPRRGEDIAPCQSPRFMAPIHVRILEVFPTHDQVGRDSVEPLFRARRSLAPPFMAPMRGDKTVRAAHEPYPSSCPSLSGGEGARRGVEVDSGRFMATGSPSRFLILGRITPDPVALRVILGWRLLLVIDHHTSVILLVPAHRVEHEL